MGQRPSELIAPLTRQLNAVNLETRLLICRQEGRPRLTLGARVQPHIRRLPRALQRIVTLLLQQFLLQRAIA